MSLYTKEILSRANLCRPLGKRAAEAGEIVLERANLMCGDIVKIYLKTDSEIITHCEATADGCAICRATAVTLEECCKGKDILMMKSLATRYGKLLTEDIELNDPFQMFNVLREYPMRIKCFLLPFEALVSDVL